jgi:hypothetical protein
MSAKNRIGAFVQSEESKAKAPPMKPGLELCGEHPVGRDPRQMTRDELQAAGHEPMSPLQALRARCLDCCNYQEKEVALCPAVDCPSWPFRMGTDPWRKPASHARREAARRTMEMINARRRPKGDDPGSSAGPQSHGTTPVVAAGSGAAPISAPGRIDRSPDTERNRENGGGRETRVDQRKRTSFVHDRRTVTPARGSAE